MRKEKQRFSTYYSPHIGEKTDEKMKNKLRGSLGMTRRHAARYVVEQQSVAGE